MALWTTGKDLQMFIHPPLTKRVAGLAALLAGANPSASATDFHGPDTLYRTNADRADRILAAARWATAAGALALTAVLALTARRLWGDGAGMLAASLGALEPNLLAHGSLATTDFLPALFLTLFAAALLPLASGRPISRAGPGLWAGLAFASKFTAGAFLPAIAAGAWLSASRIEGWRPPLRRLLSATPRIAAYAALTTIAVYSIHFRFLEPGYGTHGFWSWFPVRIAGEVNYYLPVGLQWAYRYSAEGAPAYFHGALREGFVPAYFPAVLLLKVPLAIFALAGLALALGGAAGARGALVFGALGMVVSVLNSRLHIGLRHVLPAVPLLILAAASILDHALPRRRLRVIAAVFGMLWAAGSTLRAAPHFLAHFNELAGGPAGGWRWFSDSSIDWGQDLTTLKRWMDAHDVKEIPLYYFGRADPAFHGVGVSREGPDTRGWKGGLVAISVSYLNGTTTGTLDRFGWARSLVPVATPGWSIHVYDMQDLTSLSRPSSSRTH